MNRRIGRDGHDALLWAIAPSVLLAMVGIGAVSGDAVKHANSFSTGSWGLNPNHLLMEPIAAAWFAVVSFFDLGATGPDRLKLLDILTGALSLGIFRRFVATDFAVGRVQRNLATAVLGGTFAYLALWTSGEPIILQIPALLLSGHAVVRYARMPSRSRALGVGAAFGLASLFFISNAVIGVFVGVALLSTAFRREVGRRRILEDVVLLTGGAAGVFMTAVLVGWHLASPDVSLFSWLARYAGEVPASETVYGIGSLTLENVAMAAARSVYGAVMAIVDVSPTVAAMRGEIEWAPVPALAPVPAVVAGAAIIYSILHVVAGNQRERGLAMALGGWLLGVLAFGVYFNNSDDQFFVQMSVPLALLAASVDGRSDRTGIRKDWLAGAACLVLAWNAVYVTDSIVLYPRQHRLDRISAEVEGGDLVVYPGHDEPGRLLHLLPEGLYNQSLSLMTLADRYPSERGLEILADSIAGVVDRGGSVRLVALYDANPMEQPWSILERLGYGQDRVMAIFERCEMATLDPDGGGFGTREIAGPTNCIQVRP